MKQMLKRLLPPVVRDSLRAYRDHRRLIGDFTADRRRYTEHMFPEDHVVDSSLTGRGLEGQLTKDYHRIEKGLALASPKRPFGAAVADRLARLTPADGDAHVDAYLHHVRSARAALLSWNEDGTIDDAVSPVRAAHSPGMVDPAGFFGSRHSVRDFSPEPISQETLNKAVGLALATPSVCNRQPWHVRLLQDPAQIAHARQFQNGNAGIERIPCLAIVTVDVRLFAGAGERNQGWIEGGLFAMSLVWALHALEVDTCMLNMSLTTEQMDDARTGLGIADHEIIIMMIAAGHGREGHRVARSPRRASSDVVVQPRTGDLRAH